LLPGTSIQLNINAGTAVIPLATTCRAYDALAPILRDRLAATLHVPTATVPTAGIAATTLIDAKLGSIRFTDDSFTAMEAIITTGAIQHTVRITYVPLQYRATITATPL
jgi:hypothetical protein